MGADDNDMKNAQQIFSMSNGQDECFHTKNQ